MTRETDYKNIKVSVPFGEDEIEVAVRVELETRFWEENHGPGLREPMSETVRVGYEIEGDAPEGQAFTSALESILDEEYPTE